MIRRLFVVAAMAAAFVSSAAAPALADPARPTHFESEVDRIEPAVSGATVTVVGGDAFLEVAAGPGVAVLVPGYEGEPYLRVDPDGTVSVNRNSPAHWLNTDRYAGEAVPETAVPEAEPDWIAVGEGGTWAWHDHRIHWMSPDRPAPEELSWSVPMQVDGNSVVVHGTLRWLPGKSPVPWLIVLVAAGAAAMAAARRGAAWLGAVVALGGAAATVLSLSQAAATPPGAGGDPVPLWTGVGATMLGLLTMVLSRRPAVAGDVPALIGAVVLLVWGLRRLTTLWLPVLPTGLPAAAERSLVAVVLGAAVAALVVAFGRRVTPAIGRSPAPG